MITVKEKLGIGLTKYRTTVCYIFVDVVLVASILAAAVVLEASI